MKCILVTALIVSAGATVPLKADLLDFTWNACSSASNGSGGLVACVNGSYINQSYGTTASVSVTFKDLINSGSSLKWWSTGYNNLPDAVWGGNGDSVGLSWDRIEIAPVAGHTVLLN